MDYELLLSKATPTISYNKVNMKSTLFTSLKSFTLELVIKMTTTIKQDLFSSSGN